MMKAFLVLVLFTTHASATPRGREVCFTSFISSTESCLRCCCRNQGTALHRSLAPFTDTKSKLKGATINESDLRYRHLLDWLKSQGAYIHNCIELRPSALGGGYGAFVTQNVAAQEILFTVPRSACITMDTVLSDPRTGGAFADLMQQAGPGSDTVALAGYMVQKRLEQLGKGQECSPDDDEVAFDSYLATLPWGRGDNATAQEHILYWSNDEVESLLKGTTCYEDAIDLRAALSRATTVVHSILKRNTPLLLTDAAPSFRFFPWQQQDTRHEHTVTMAMTGAFVSIFTRAFQDNGEYDKLVPLLDLLQHADPPNIGHVMRRHDGTVEVRARHDLPAGTELLNQYHAELDPSMPVHRFYTRFGFVPGLSSRQVLQMLRDKTSDILFAQELSAKRSDAV